MNQDDRGAAEVVALMVIAPVVVALVVLVFFTGRQVDARSTVRSAADAAAQAAAQQRSAVGADQAARAAVAVALGGDDTNCSPDPTIDVDLTAFAPGGTVRVTVTCTIDRSDLGGLAPPARSFSATGVAVVDTYRAGALP